MSEIKNVNIDQLSPVAGQLVRNAFGANKGKSVEDRFACYAGQAFASEMLRREGCKADAELFDARSAITFAFIDEDEEGLIVYNDNSLRVGVHPAREIWTDALDFKNMHAETFLALSKDRTTPRYLLDFDFYCNTMMAYAYENKFPDHNAPTSSAYRY